MSSSSSTGRLDIAGLYASRARTRTESWEVDFQKNHKAFAEEIAQSIVHQAIESLKKTLSDPYSKTNNLFTTYISLDITQSASAKQLAIYAKSTGTLPPFKEWLERFSPEKEQAEPDVAYFRDLMAIVSRVAAAKIKALLSEQAFQFEVAGHRKSGPLLKDPTDFSENCLRIDCYFKNKATISATASPSRSATITKYRAEQDKRAILQGMHMLTIAAFLSSVFAYFYLSMKN